MLGWEYPPHIAGGLGTACEGLSRALADQHVGLTFVVPRVFGDEPASHMNLIGASQVKLAARTPSAPAPREGAARPASMVGTQAVEWLDEGIHTLAIDSLLSPYDRPQTYQQRFGRYVTVNSLRIEPGVAAPATDGQPARAAETAAQATPPGHYAGDLYSEVTRYAHVVGQLAAHTPHEVIHAHDWMTYPAALEARRVSGKPVVLHVHSLEYDRSGEHVNEAINRLERAGLRAADRIVAVSHYTKSLVTRMHGVDAAKISVVHNGVTRSEGLQQYHLPEDREHKTVLFMGRITFQKGPEYFVRAAQKVLGRINNVRFVMAGSGDMVEPMKQLVRQLKLDAAFEFPGFLRGTERERYFTLADVYVMPSVSEPFGITPLEAMAYDVPVIISRQSGVSEVLRHALKVDFWDVDKMADLLMALLRHDALGQEMSRMAQKELLQLHWRAAALKLIEVYRQLAKAA
ncbi:MAG: glycosyltransferase family 4 protein [Planctomycetes bacterium]|nr:glycosyltransferase family 4 protein [Planctomycetota bacterium]